MSASDPGSDTVLLEAEDIRDFNSDNILPLPATELAKIIKWLQPTPYDFERGEYSRHRASHLRGTGSWLTSTELYQQWHSGDNGLLWIKGIPGSGKSVMAASLIKKLQEENHPVIYFFFRQIIEANHKPIVALRDWLCQILDYSPPLQAKLKKYVDQTRSLGDLSPQDLWSDLKMALLHLPRVYCVTDALDEMDLGNDDFLRDLVGLGQLRPSIVKVLMTSRPIARLETFLRPFSIPQIRLQERQVDLDIASYVHHRLRGSSIAREDWGAIQDAIPGRANGIFLYAKMSLDVFLEPGVDVQQALKALPMDLNVMYNGLLQEHARRSNVPSELQRLILQFVTHATRPLRLLELAVMLSVHSQNSRPLKEIKALVRAACGPLLEVLPDETVSVIHHTFTEFLNGSTRSRSPESSEYPIFEPGPTNLRLATECLHYMQTGCLDSIEVPKSRRCPSFAQVRENRKKMQQIWLRHPFLEYAAKNWYKHGYQAEASDEDLKVFHETLDGFFAEAPRLNAWLGLAWPDPSFDGIKPIHIAARTGLSRFAEHILSRGEAIDTESTIPPISWAASYNHGNVIRVLLNHGTDPDVELNEGLKPMHLAANSNHVDAVKCLIAAGVSPLTPKLQRDARPGSFHKGPGGKGHTPLMYACHAGHLETVTEFVRCLNVEEMHQAMHWAAENGRSSIVELILQQPGIDVNVKLEGETALLLACKRVDLNTIRLLINGGADPTLLHGQVVEGPEPHFPTRDTRPTTIRSNNRRYTVLHTLCRVSLVGRKAESEAAECVKVLAQAGADVHARDDTGLTALHHAFKSSVHWINPLLDAGADPTMEDDNQNTVLHLSSNNDEEALCLILKSEKADINKARAKDGMTPLLCRLADNRSDVSGTIKLLAYKPDMNVVDSKGDGPLHLALKRMNVDPKLIHELLAAGANPNSKNAAGNTPLHQASSPINTEIFEYLVQAGADLEICNNRGESVLFARLTRASNGRGLIRKPEILRQLAKEGACLDTRDRKGRTLWHCAIDCIETLTVLKSLGLDHSVSDHEGNTPIHEVVADKMLRRKRNVLEELMGMGMDINQRNHRGQTALHFVCSRLVCENDRQESVHKTFEYILKNTECPKVADHDGIQPVHIAATISEIFVYKLLNSGADICAATNDKMTILHIASRARQSGIVDMVLLRAKSLLGNSRLNFVNAQDGDGRTALHYACRSGRPETVKSLLEAGAAIDLLDIHKHSPLAMCGEFDKEASLWYRQVLSPDPPIEQSVRGLNAGGLMLKDDTRPFLDHTADDAAIGLGRIKSENETTRLGEIINLLIKHGVDMERDQESLEHAWDCAAQPEYGYTLSCLPPLSGPPRPHVIHIGGRRPGGETDDPDTRQLKISIAKSYRKALEETLQTNAEQKRAIEIAKLQDYDSSKFDKQSSMQTAKSLRVRRLNQSRRLGAAEQSLALRLYDLFESLSGGRDNLHVHDYDGYTSLNLLARWGFTDLLKHLCTRETVAQLDNVNYTTNRNEEDLECGIPLVVSACQRELPNMDVLRLMVEGFGANVNAKSTRRVYSNRRLVPAICNGALHDLALGRHWWHVNKALPYLIQMGADINIRNREGETPLIAALKSPSTFSRDAVEIFIRAGADVNAVDNENNTCLSIWGVDMDLTKLLLENGAEVTPFAFLSALKFKKLKVLETLLSHEGNSIVNQPLPEGSSRTDGLREFKTVGLGALPLLWVASNNDDLGGFSRRKKLMNILLRHGANPYSTFEQRQYRSNTLVEPENFPVTTVTLIHVLLSGGHIIDPIFNLPFLDMEYRDANGCTLILAASKFENSRDIQTGSAKQLLNDTDPLPELIKRGANVMAQDNEGRTILHHIGRNRVSNLIGISTIKEALQTAVTTTPGLVHQTDSNNESALHYALRIYCREFIEFLLDNGADPLQPDRNGDTALHILANFNKDWTKDLLETFVRAGLDINARNKIGETPLFSLLKQGNDSDYGSAKDQTYKCATFEYFLECGADAFARSDDGSTLLHIVAGSQIDRLYAFGRLNGAPRRMGVARFKRLMDMGLDPMAEDHRQRTSIDVAAACENDSILKLFKRERLA